MTYTGWFNSHKEKRNSLINSLICKGLSDEEIVMYFRWTNMMKKEPEYCGLYKENKKCHNLQELNCLYCACPYFVFDDNGLEQGEDGVCYSKCIIDSKFGTYFEHEKAIHQDCTLCLMPHTKQFAFKYFRELKEEITLKD